MQTYEKLGIGSITGLFCYILGCINYMWVILAVLVIFDYISGITATIICKEKFDKSKALIGAIQKLCYFLVLIVAVLCDYMAADLGVQLADGKAISFVLVVYFIGTEGLSFLQNLSRIGMPLPSPLQAFFNAIAHKD